jgi:hypothetical protein
VLKARLVPTIDGPLSNVAFNFHLRRYTAALDHVGATLVSLAHVDRWDDCGGVPCAETSVDGARTSMGSRLAKLVMWRLFLAHGIAEENASARWRGHRANVDTAFVHGTIMCGFDAPCVAWKTSGGVGGESFFTTFPRWLHLPAPGVSTDDAGEGEGETCALDTALSSPDAPMRVCADTTGVRRALLRRRHLTSETTASPLAPPPTATAVPSEPIVEATLPGEPEQSLDGAVRRMESAMIADRRDGLPTTEDLLREGGSTSDVEFQGPGRPELVRMPMDSDEVMDYLSAFRRSAHDHRHAGHARARLLHKLASGAAIRVGVFGGSVPLGHKCDRGKGAAPDGAPSDWESYVSPNDLPPGVSHLTEVTLKGNPPAGTENMNQNCAYSARFAKWLGTAFPNANHTVANFAMGGKTTIVTITALNGFIDLLERRANVTVGRCKLKPVLEAPIY